MHSDFWKGCAIFFLVLIAFVTLFTYIGNLGTYIDARNNQRMESCQANGYTWGECYNVIHGDKNDFDK